ncbi:DoxX family membrane protein [Streptomyces sp. NPDC001678]|uniref:DoxX family membrane protein n=1 Tax=Streptomyces sp. NPDC001678 TaxID=3364599 RepID=UPI00368899F0
MAVLRTLARPLLASAFISAGVQTVRRPELLAPVAAPVALAIADWIPVLPRDARALVRLNGAVHLGAGGLLALGILPRLSALTLAASLVPTTLAGHAYWREDDPGKRMQHRVAFFANVSILGGLLAIAADHGVLKRRTG